MKSVPNTGDVVWKVDFNGEPAKVLIIKRTPQNIRWSYSNSQRTTFLNSHSFALYWMHDTFAGARKEGLRYMRKHVAYCKRELRDGERRLSRLLKAKS
jgi:hypothetical protein